MNSLSQLNEYADNYDLAAMDSLVENLSPAALLADRQAIIDLYNLVYQSARYDLDCGAVNEHAAHIGLLLGILDSIQRFFPNYDRPYYLERGQCYEDLAYCAPAEDKLRYIEEAIRMYNSAPATTRIQLAIVRSLIDKMAITGQFTTEAFNELLPFFRLALNDASLVKALIHICFRVRALPFEQATDWHQLLLQEFETVMHEEARQQPLVYLDWAEAYHNLLGEDAPAIDPEYRSSMIDQTVSLLKPLDNYYTEDRDILHRLGTVFTKTARRSTNGGVSVAHYQTAIRFFTKIDELHRTIWHYPANVIRILPELARRYYQQGDRDKMINTFEYGLDLFSQIPKNEEDFMSNIHWGELLIVYSGLAYDYQSDSLNALAIEKLQLAKAELLQYDTHPYFSRPYLSMARLAIKSGDKEKCIALLQECKEAIRAKGFVKYELNEALEDEDFRQVWEELRS